MRTIAQKYIEEVEAKGEAKLLKMMLINGNFVEEIARITKLPVSSILELLKVG